METRHSFCFFCDDVRHEIDNKVSIMGVHGPTLMFTQLPQIIPKFCILAVFRSPAEEKIRSAYITITFEKQLLAQFHIPEDQIALANTGGGIITNEEYPLRLISLGATYVIAQLPVEKNGAITVTFTVDDVDYIAGRIMLLEI